MRRFFFKLFLNNALLTFRLAFFLWLTESSYWYWLRMNYNFYENKAIMLFCNYISLPVFLLKCTFALNERWLPVVNKNIMYEFVYRFVYSTQHLYTTWLRISSMIKKLFLHVTMEPLAYTHPTKTVLRGEDILLEVSLFSQNRTDSDWENEKHRWWRAGAPTSWHVGEDGSSHLDP